MTVPEAWLAVDLGDAELEAGRRQRRPAGTDPGAPRHGDGVAPLDRRVGRREVAAPARVEDRRHRVVPDGRALAATEAPDVLTAAWG